MRILLLTHAFNSLTQRLFVELRDRGHEVMVEFDVHDAVTIDAVRLARPDLVVAPFLKRRIPAEVFDAVPCLVVHPGPPGDRGPSALDWAILEGRETWGVTVLQATADLDGGPVWASETLSMRAATKSSLYRTEVTEAAVRCVLRCLEHPEPRPAPEGTWKPLCRQADRAIDWARDDTATVLRKIRSADGDPGLRDVLDGREVWLFDATEASYSGSPGTLIGRCGTALCRATTDGAVWLGALRVRDAQPSIKLPATLAWPAELPELNGWSDIRYEEQGGVGTLHFPFHNGAMSAEQCERLRAAFEAAAAGPAKVLVLAGGPEFWSNGIHLNTIEAAASPAEESWRSINAIDDLARAVITTTDKLTISALAGNAGAGGVFLALAADQVWARDGVVLNPHYKGMGNLYGSEYWTYLLPHRCGADNARSVTQARLPVGVVEARALGLIDAHFATDRATFAAEVQARAEALAASPELPRMLADKAARRAADEAEKPLEQYRADELEQMKLNFFGFDPSYHVARYNFVLRVPKSRTPLYLATHRRTPGRAGGRDAAE